MNVDIEYCVPCGLLDRAIEVERDLLQTFGRDLQGVQLTPGHGGVFRIRVDGDKVFDSHEDAYDLDHIRALVAQRLGG